MRLRATSHTLPSRPQQCEACGRKHPSQSTLGARHQFTEHLRSILHLHPRRSPTYPPTQWPVRPKSAWGPPVWTMGSGAEWASPGETAYLPPDGAVPGPPAPAVSLRQRSKPVPSADSREHRPGTHAILLSLALPSYSDTCKLTLSLPHTQTHKEIQIYISLSSSFLQKAETMEIPRGVILIISLISQISPGLNSSPVGTWTHKGRRKPSALENQGVLHRGGGV